MKVIYTDQAYESLNELSQFLLVEQSWPLEKVLELRAKILDKADDLDINYNHYQIEEYLEHIGKEHRRAVEGYFKIIYRVEGESVIVTDFFDTRQDPTKMKS